METHKEIFTRIYDKNIWGGSGGGSDPENTVEYREFLQKFLKDRNIQSVVDYGCGDWAFSKMIDWTGVSYLGIDCVESVVRINKKRFTDVNLTFMTADNYDMVGGAELLILKDVLQHWSVADINSFLHDVFLNKDFKYVLIVNTASQEYDNQDIEAGDTRGLCARFDPLKKYNPEVLTTIQSSILSEVLLITK